MGFACRHIDLGAQSSANFTHLSITHAIEAFIIINWFFTLVILILSLTKVNWECENLEEHRMDAKLLMAYTQFGLSILLIGLLAGYFQLWTEGEPVLDTSIVNLTAGFGILFAVLQCVSGASMIQQCGTLCPGQVGETVSGLLKVVNSFGVIAFGFACRCIYVTAPASPGPSAHLIAAESFIIVNFFVSLACSYATAMDKLNWDSDNSIRGKRHGGLVYGLLQTIFAIVLFGLLAGLIEMLTEANDDMSSVSLNAAGPWMVLFGILFAVLEVFAGFTMLQAATKKMPGLNASTVDVTNKVAMAVGALAFGFACRHINLFIRKGASGNQSPLVHAIESFIIINFFLTWIIEIRTVKGRIEW